MIQISRENKEKVQAGIKKGVIDAAKVGSPNFVDEIILSAQRNGVLEKLEGIIEDRRRANRSIPMHMILTLSVAAKMKQHTSLSDIPFAIMDAETLAELGCALWDTDRDLAEGLFDEGSLRHLLGKYEGSEFIDGYNRCVQQRILPHVQMSATIHLLDCTKLEVALSNANYEGASVVTDEDGKRRGYKLSTLRGIVKDGGVIEEIRLGTMKEHDLSLSRDMILQSPMLKPGDILVNDRGFLSRDVLNELKAKRQVDTYVPLRINMDAYVQAVSLAKAEGKWQAHPNKKRKTQKIAFVPGLGDMWRSERTDEDVPINGCVVWDSKTDTYAVFVTTDTGATAKQIIMTYEMRPEIEEEYRQLKDFWQMDDFKSTKLHVIMFHIVCTLLGYLLFQLYIACEEGKEWAGHSLPVIVKKYTKEKPKSVIVYVGQFFAVFAFLEFIQLYASIPPDVRKELDGILRLV